MEFSRARNKQTSCKQADYLSLGLQAFSAHGLQFFKMLTAHMYAVVYNIYIYIHLSVPVYVGLGLVLKTSFGSFACADNITR